MCSQEDYISCKTKDVRLSDDSTADASIPVKLPSRCCCWWTQWCPASRSSWTSVTVWSPGCPRPYGEGTSGRTYCRTSAPTLRHKQRKHKQRSHTEEWAGQVFAWFILSWVNVLIIWFLFLDDFYVFCLSDFNRVNHEGATAASFWDQESYVCLTKYLQSSSHQIS